MVKSCDKVMVQSSQVECSSYFDVKGLSAFGEKLPGASLVMTAFSFRWSD
jgi:hypothetical protein